MRVTSSKAATDSHSSLFLRFPTHDTCTPHRLDKSALSPARARFWHVLSTSASFGELVGLLLRLVSSRSSSACTCTPRRVLATACNTYCLLSLLVNFFTSNAIAAILLPTNEYIRVGAIYTSRSRGWVLQHLRRHRQNLHKSNCQLRRKYRMRLH